MNCSAKILVTLATLPAIPLLLLAGAIFGVFIGLKAMFMWIGFVWEEL